MALLSGLHLLFNFELVIKAFFNVLFMKGLLLYLRYLKIFFETFKREHRLRKIFYQILLKTLNITVLVTAIKEFLLLPSAKIVMQIDIVNLGRCHAKICSVSFLFQTS